MHSKYICLCSSTYGLQNLEALQHWSLKIRGALQPAELLACTCCSGMWVHEWAREHQPRWFLLLACFSSFLLSLLPSFSSSIPLFHPVHFGLSLPSYRSVSHIFLDNWEIGSIFKYTALNKTPSCFFSTPFIRFFSIRKLCLSLLKLI